MSINKKQLWLLFAVAIIIRLLSLAMYPLMDTTEARYGDMARMMVETGNWLTPQFDYGVPFWGKPPLFTWMSATGIQIFGINEFAVRLPHWIAGVITIGFVAFFVNQKGFNALVASVVLATCCIFSIAAGAVMTDMALTFGITLTMLGFYNCWRDQEARIQWWGYLSFVGLAIGLLAKGPVALVIIGIAVMPWLILQHGLIGSFVQLWKRFPIVSGLTLMLLITLPWYIMAEMATPGFLDYFIIGEHFKRFVVSGWEGDLYGSAHNQPRGMIWLFWIAAAFPWSFALPAILWKKKAKIQQIQEQHSGLFSFLVCWLIAPMLLFTMAGNILPAYVLPGIPALGIIVALLIDKEPSKKFFSIAAIMPALLIVAVVILNFGVADKNSDRVIISNITTQDPVYYVGKRPFSAQFYSHGQTHKLSDPQELDGLANYYLVGRQRDVDPVVQSNNLNCVIELEANSKRTLYRCQKANEAS